MTSSWMRGLAPFLFAIVTGVGAGQPMIDYRIMSESGVQIDGLHEPHGQTVLITYFLPDLGPTVPSLVVRLSWPSADVALAEVFDFSELESGLAPIVSSDGSVLIPSGLLPRIEMEALGGFWTAGSLPNYDLNVSVRGRIRATMNSISFFPFVTDSETLVEITVRRDATGYPHWDLRQAVPEARRAGYARANYAERTCSPPAHVESGVSPDWPFVAAEGGFFPKRGQLEPPIKVDWTGRVITDFSEIVTVRNHTCSYSLYSISPLEAGTVTAANFETPFAFYDLSGEASRWPNLIVRTAHFAAGDPWSATINRPVQRGAVIDRDYVGIRYSWRSAIGDGLWDYKVEVLGHHPFTYSTPIAGGAYAITAPPYDEYPGWVTDRSWPGVAFVDTEGKSYTSSEGIYDLRPGEAGFGYALGWSDEYQDIPPTALRPGFRGEYRVTTDQPVRLYMSPVDNRLHLLGAEHGFMRLDQHRLLTVEDRSGDGYIDTWVLDEPRFDRALSDVGAASNSETNSGTLQEQSALHQYGQLLLFAADGLVIIREHDGTKSLFEITPPDDAASWQRFVDTVRPFNAIRRDYGDLKGWLDAFPGATVRLEAVSITQLQLTAERLRFVLEVAKGITTESDWTSTPFAELIPGTYVVTYSAADGGWEIEVAEPPRLQVGLDARTTRVGVSTSGMLVLDNGGTVDTTANVEIWMGGQLVEVNDSLYIPGHGRAGLPFVWSPGNSGDIEVTAVVDGMRVDLGPIRVDRSSRPEAWTMITSSSRTPMGRFATGLLLVLGCIVVVFASGLLEMRWSRQ